MKKHIQYHLNTFCFVRLLYNHGNNSLILLLSNFLFATSERKFNDW